MEKYYTPEIEEFHIWFEYEWKCDGTKTDWTRSVCDSNMNPLDCDCRRINDYRVKYLDKEDIESFGFDHDQTTKDGSDYYKGSLISDSEFRLNTNKQNPTLINIWNLRNNEQIFCGIIKNKSELKVLLKQLNIL